MDDIVVRQVHESDLPALADLARRTWSDAFGDSVSSEDEAVELGSKRSEAFFAQTLRERTTLVADADGELVGYVQFGDVSIPEVDARPGDRELHRVYVATELQGRGIGRQLMDAALAHPRLAAAERVYLQVWETNERAIGLYESLGFETVGRTTFTIGANHVTEDLVMLLDRSG